MKYIYCLLLCLFSLAATNRLVAQCVNDKEPPTITCAQAVTAVAAPGSCTASITVAQPMVSDNCTPAETLDQQNTSANSAIGAAGGSFNQSFTPNITGYLTRLDIDISGYSSPDATLSIYDGDNTNVYGPSGPLLYSQPVTLSTGFPTFILSQPVHLVKGHMYTWQLSGPNQINGDLGTDNPYPGGHLGSYDQNGNSWDLLFKTYVLPDAVTFTNDYNNSPDASGVYPAGVTAVTWTATDFSGNTSTCVTTVTVTDDQLPVITGCPSDIASCAGVVNWTAPTATDNCGIASFTSNYAPGATFPPGTTTVTYTATDIHGNVATCSFNVTVTDVTAQITGNTLLCPGATTTLSASGNYSSYLWSTGAQTQSIMVSTPGKYVLTTSENNCTAKDSVTITLSSLTDKGYQTNGDAFANGGNCFTVTPAQSAVRGSVWYKDKIDLNYDFDMSFTTNQCGTADGMMFVLQNSGLSALGSDNGSTLGYYQTPAFSKSLGVELDIFNSGPNDPFYDPSASHISIVTNDNAYPVSSAVNVAPDLNNCADRAFRVTWNHTTHLFSVYLDGALITSYTSDLVATVFGGSSSVYMGFTGATGSLTATQTFCADSLQYTSGPLAISPSATLLCGGGKLSVNAAPGSSFLWSTGATTDTITITSSGHYSVTVSNGDGCSQTAAYDAVVTPVPTITANGATANLCPGTTVNLTASSGTSYSWSNDDTTATIAVSSAGTYNVTVNGCLADSEVAVTYKPVLSISASGPTTFCPGYSTDLSAPASASYSWSTNETTQTIHVTTGGTYSVTVSDSDGCVQNLSQDVTVRTLAAPDLISYTGTDICSSYFGYSDFYPSNTDYSLSYSASPSDSVTDYGYGYFTTAYPGTYTVTAQDQLGCVSPSSTITITGAPGDPNVFGNNTWNVYAFDDSYSGIPWTQYYNDGYTEYNLYKGYYTDDSLSFDTRNRWNPDGAPSDASGYQGCSVPEDYHSWTAKRKGFPCGHYQIYIPGHDDDAELYVNGVQVWQEAGAVLDSSVVWEGNLGPNTTVEFRGEDNYGGSFGATTFNLVNSSIITKPIITPSGSVTVCQGSSLTLTSSSGTGNIWSTGDTTQSITVNTAGNYSLTVTGSEGCSSPASDTVRVSVTPMQTFYADADGDGYGNPAVSVQACTQPAGYVSNNGDCDDTHASVYPGAPEICDGLDNDCNGIIDDPCYKLVVAKASSTAASACVNDGAIKLTASGGKSPYLYSLDGATYVTTNTFTGLAAGSYTGYVKDSRNAVGTVVTTVKKVAALVVTSSTASASACLNNGKITLGRTGGTSPFTYSLDGVNYVSTNVFNNLAAGTYTGYVKDAKGCTASQPNIIVGQKAAIVVTSSTVAASACADDGKITLSRTGGTSPFTYSLDGSTYVTTRVFTGLAAGSYTGYVKDAKGCVASKDSIIVGKLPEMVVSYTKTNATKCPSNGSITLSKTGGTSPYLYSINGSTYGSSNKFSNLAPGTYTGYVKDAKGCIATSSVIVITGPSCGSNLIAATKENSIAAKPAITVMPNPARSSFGVQMSGFNGKTALQLRSLDGKLLRQAEVQAFGGVTQQSFDVADLAGGTYLLTVMDGKGNIINTKVVVAR